MNQNRGYKILLRLRPHEAQDTFYDQEQLVLVMLHEVTLPGYAPAECVIADTIFCPFCSSRIMCMVHTTQSFTNSWEN